MSHPPRTPHSAPRPAADADVDSDAVLARIPSGLPTYAFPRGPSTAGAHAHVHSQLDAESFVVRGATYLEDREKLASAPAMFDLMHVDIFRAPEKISNVAARGDSWLRLARAAGDTRQYLVVVYVTPAAPYIHLIIYFAAQPARVRANPHFASLWERFCKEGAEGDAFRNDRWKVIPRIAEGPWAVKYAVGTKPALLGTKLSHSWVVCGSDGSCSSSAHAEGGGAAGRRRSAAGAEAASAAAAVAAAAAAASTTPLRAGSAGAGAPAASDGAPGTGGRGSKRGSASSSRSNSLSGAGAPGPYVESDCDVSSSSMAFVLVSLLQSSARFLAIELGFTIEPREEECLPEVILGAVRLSGINIEKAELLSADLRSGVNVVEGGEEEEGGREEGGVEGGGGGPPAAS